MPILSEIKRRRVFQVAGAYLVAAWLVLQVVSEVIDPLGLPEWLDTATIIFLASGFPVALLLSWVFDWTPKGIVRTSSDVGDEKHPQIAMLQDERRPLRDLMTMGPMPTPRLLSIAGRLADELANLHRKGRVHGDLRPANVIVHDGDQVELRSPGRIKRRISKNRDNPSLYLSPECARGEDPDFRSDQFSFGALLYEMAAGRAAFSGANDAETLSAVGMANPPPVSRFNPRVPMPLQWLIERCLAKTPSDRFSSTEDLRKELEAIAATSQRAAISQEAKHNLPAQPTRLIGRDSELGEIKRALLSKDARIVTLVGAGGIGKTRLMIELGWQLLEDFPGGTFFVALDRVNDSELVATEIANALNVQHAPDRPIVSELQSHLRENRTSPTLLLIDNFEHVVAAAPLLGDLLIASEQLEIVVTSRAALRVYGELEFRVGPLLTTERDTSSATTLAQSPAVRLFLERAASFQAREAKEGELGLEDLQLIAEICERLDGLPLAIELAAARTRVLSLPELLERVRDPLRVLAGGPRDLPARQQTLRATLQWSYDLLDDSQKKLFRRFGVFVGGAVLEAIEAVCDANEDLGLDLIEGVESLVDSSLLRRIDGESETRFEMPESMREYALEELDNAGEDAYSHRAHAAYFVVLAEEAPYLATESQRGELYRRFDRELGNLRSALNWLVEAADADWGLRLVAALGDYWARRGHAAEGYAHCESFLALEGASAEVRAMALPWAGELAIFCRRIDDAIRLDSESIEANRKLNIVPNIVRSLNARGIVYRHAGELEKSTRSFEEAIEVARDAGGSPMLVAGALGNLADQAKLQGDYDLAQRLQTETSELVLAGGDPSAHAWSLSHQGDIARMRGNFEFARGLYEESLSKFRELEERFGIAGCLYDLAAISAETGDYQTAEKLNGEALSLYWELDHTADFPRVLGALADCAVRSGQPERALTLAGAAAAILQSLILFTAEASAARLDRTIETARERLSDSEASSSWMTGWSMHPDRAIAFALGRPEAEALDAV